MTLNGYLAKKELTPSAFAETIGVPASTVSRWINGERTPRIESIASIEKATDGAVTMADFLGGQAAHEEAHQ